MIGAVVWKQRLKMEAGPHIRGPSRSLFQAVRTESNAGAEGDMRSRVPVRTFSVWNVAGGLVWSLGVTLIGFVVGKSIKIMLEAHNSGRAVVIVCPLEPAELYRDRLESCSPRAAPAGPSSPTMSR